MGEYALLFAIVLGAVIAMQSYVKQRLQGAIAFRADEYLNSAGTDVGTFEPVREVTSDSETTLTMTTAKAGDVSLTSKSTTTQTK